VITCFPLYFRKWLLLKRKKKHRNPSPGKSSVVTSYVPAQRVAKSCCQCVGETARCHNDGTTTSKSPSDSSAICVLNDTERKLLEHEIEVCTCAADRYPNNYNAWSHRSWLIQQFGSGDIQVHNYFIRLYFVKFISCCCCDNFHMINNDICMSTLIKLKTSLYLCCLKTMSSFNHILHKMLQTVVHNTQQVY